MVVSVSASQELREEVTPPSSSQWARKPGPERYRDLDWPMQGDCIPTQPCDPQTGLLSVPALRGPHCPPEAGDQCLDLRPGGGAEHSGGGGAVESVIPSSPTLSPIPLSAPLQVWLNLQKLLAACCRPNTPASERLHWLFPRPEMLFLGYSHSSSPPRSSRSCLRCHLLRAGSPDHLL